MAPGLVESRVGGGRIRSWGGLFSVLELSRLLVRGSGPELVQGLWSRAGRGGRPQKPGEGQPLGGPGGPWSSHRMAKMLETWCRPSGPAPLLPHIPGNLPRSRSSSLHAGPETITFLHWLLVLGRAPAGTGRAGPRGRSTPDPCSLGRLPPPGK